MTYEMNRILDKDHKIPTHRNNKTSSSFYHDKKHKLDGYSRLFHIHKSTR